MVKDNKCDAAGSVKVAARRAIRIMDPQTSEVRELHIILDQAFESRGDK